MDSFQRALQLLPAECRKIVQAIGPQRVEEIRLRRGQAPALVIAGKERRLTLPALREEDLIQVLERASSASLHASAEAMTESYLSCGGLRIGVCGTVDLRDGAVHGYRRYSSLNIRIPRAFPGILDHLMEREYGAGFQNTLVVSPPGGGKTTALREMIRWLSERGVRMGVIDERDELSAAGEGEKGFDLGPCSDVLVNCPKMKAAMLLLRTMSPQVIAMDEITKEEDAAAVREIQGCGVGLLASAHGESVENLLARTLYRELFSSGVFSRVLVIGAQGGNRSYQMVVLSDEMDGNDFDPAVCAEFFDKNNPGPKGKTLPLGQSLPSSADNGGGAGERRLSAAAAF